MRFDAVAPIALSPVLCGGLSATIGTAALAIVMPWGMILGGDDAPLFPNTTDIGGGGSGGSGGCLENTRNTMSLVREQNLNALLNEREREREHDSRLGRDTMSLFGCTLSQVVDPRNANLRALLAAVAGVAFLSRVAASNTRTAAGAFVSVSPVLVWAAALAMRAAASADGSGAPTPTSTAAFARAGEAWDGLTPVVY